MLAATLEIVQMSHTSELSSRGDGYGGGGVVIRYGEGRFIRYAFRYHAVGTGLVPKIT